MEASSSLCPQVMGASGFKGFVSMFKNKVTNCGKQSSQNTCKCLILEVPTCKSESLMPEAGEDEIEEDRQKTERPRLNPFIFFMIKPFPDNHR